MKLILPYAALFSVACFWGLSFEKGELRSQLIWLSPLTLEINFILILIMAFACRNRFKELFRNISKRALRRVLFLATSGTLLTMLVAPRTHRIFYDELIYLNVGQNIADLRKAAMCNEGGTRYDRYFCNRMEHNKEPNGWPYIMSLLFRITGARPLIGFLLNNFIFGLTIPVVFLIGFLLFRSERAALFGALFFTTIPQGLIWSNTATVEPSAALFGSIALLSVILFARQPDLLLLLFASLLLPFAFQFRPESILITVPTGLCLLLMVPHKLREKSFWMSFLVLLILSLPHFMHLYTVKGGDWGAPSGTSKLALTYLKSNLSINCMFFLKNIRFPLIVTALFIAGMFFPLHNYTGNGRNRMTENLLWKEKIILLSFFLSFWGIFLFFYAGSYDYGVDVRFSLLTSMPLAVLAGYGVFSLTGPLKRKFPAFPTDAAFVILTLFSFSHFLPLIRAKGPKANACRADYKYAMAMAENLPPSSIVLTHNPNMFLIAGKNATQAYFANDENYLRSNLSRSFPGGIYFHYNYWCDAKIDTISHLCKTILKRYRAKELLSFRESNRQFGLYKLEINPP